MKIHYNLSGFLSILFICSASMSNAQDDNKELPSGSIEVVKQFKASIINANFINALPTDPNQDQHAPLVLYSNLPSKTFELNFPDPVIHPLAYQQPVVTNSKSGYIEGGYGNLSSPYAEAQFNYHIADWFDFGIDARHHSAKGTKYIHQEIADTYVQGYANYALKNNLKLSAQASYENEKRNYYHTAIVSEGTEGVLNNIQHIHTALGFDYYGFAEGRLSSTNKLNFKFKEHHYENEQLIALNSKNHFRIVNPISLGLDVDVEHFDLSTTSFDDKGIFLTAKPQLIFDNDKINIEGGVLISKSNDFSLQPNASIQYNIPETPFTAFIETKADIQRNSIYNLLNLNPWFLQGDFETSYYKSQNYSLGTTIHNAKREVTARVQYVQHNNRMIFTDQYSELDALEMHFSATTIDYNTIGLSINGESEIIDWLSIYGAVEYNHFLTDSMTTVSYLSPVSGSIGLKQYLLEDKLSIFQEVSFSGKRDAISNVGDFKTLKGYADIGIGVDYAVVGPLSLWMQASNLSNKTYERFHGYPVFGINFHGGLKLIF